MRTHQDQSLVMDWQTFFDENAPPKNLNEVKESIDDFCQAHDEGRKVKMVLVTSGGTTIPLEQNTVRFIDNFSAGTRGSASTEYFLQRGYAVVFLHRATSLKPFDRHFTSGHCRSAFLDILQFNDKSEDTGISVKDQHILKIRKLLSFHQQVKDENRLLMVPYTSLSDYLWHLRTLATRMDRCGPRAMLYLAAAVSDFYIPTGSIPKHKIQSSEGAPKIELQLVPKMLHPLIRHWMKSGALVVSFKLETDPEILIRKARKALDTYGHHIVIANLLHDRKKIVRIVIKNEEKVTDIIMTEEELTSGSEIEEKIVKFLADEHDKKSVV